MHRRVCRPVFVGENNSEGAARALSHCAFPAAVSKVQDFKCVCQDWQEGGEKLQKSSVCNEQSWVFTEEVGFYCSLVVLDEFHPRGWQIAKIIMHWFLVFIFILMQKWDYKVLLQESNVALQLNSSCFHEEWQPSGGKKPAKTMPKTVKAIK